MSHFDPFLGQPDPVTCSKVRFDPQNRFFRVDLGSLPLPTATFGILGSTSGVGDPQMVVSLGVSKNLKSGKIAISTWLLLSRRTTLEPYLVQNMSLGPKTLFLKVWAILGKTAKF